MEQSKRLLVLVFGPLNELTARPKDCSFSAFQPHLQARAKRSQLLNATYRNIVGHSMLRAVPMPETLTKKSEISNVRLPFSKSCPSSQRLG